MHTEEIWANSTDSIVTLRDFKEYGYKIDDPAWVGKKANVFLACFFNQVIHAGGDMTDDMAEEILDMLFDAREFPDRTCAENWFQENLEDIFRNLYVSGELYLENGSEDAFVPAPMTYLEAAEKLAEKYLPEELVAPAMVRVAVLCMVLVRLPNDLPQPLRKAMLSVWKGASGEEEFYEVTDGEQIVFGWEDLLGQLKRKVLKNSSAFCKEILLRGSGYGTQSILLPPHSQLTAIFADKKMVSIKGSLSANGKHVTCLHHGKFLKYHVGLDRLNQQKLEDPESIRDYAMSNTGRSHSLDEAGAVVWEDVSESRLYPGKISVFAVENVWVLLGKDGKTISNIGYLNVDDAVAVTQDAENILILDRAGKVHALDGSKTCRPEDVWNMMMGRFRNLPVDGAEQIRFKGKTIVRVLDGTLRCL